MSCEQNPDNYFEISFHLMLNNKECSLVFIHDHQSPTKFDTYYNHIGDTNFASKNFVTHFSVHKTI